MNMPVVSLYYLPAVLPVILIALLLRKIVRRIRAHSIAQLPGPPPGPWIIGNLPAVLRPVNAVEAEFKWTNTYGMSMKIGGAFGEDILLTSDPKAMQYVLNTGGYNFPKPQQSVATSRLIGGMGIFQSQGAQHARHRKVMNPGFSYSALRVFLPLFREMAQRNVSKWKDEMAQTGSSEAVFNIPSWLARTSLDIIGEAAFDYKFGALEDGDNELCRIYRNLFVNAFFNRSNFTLVFEALWGHLPISLVKVIQKLPTNQLTLLRRYLKVANSYAKNIVDTQSQAYAASEKQERKDVMSILVRANLSEDPKNKLSEEELIGQLTTLMFAGHETTAATVTWALYEFSKHPEAQRRVREEIKATRARAELRGDSELSLADYDSMKFLLATIKETLRYHPIQMFLNRIAGREDFIPLSTPVTTKTGDVITSIPVSKGQRLMLSIAVYNRLKSVWGDDAEEWRPERFHEGIEHNQKTTLGVVSNLASFSSGVRSCVGWRFAMIEMQVILTELLENFEYLPAPGNPEIVRGSTFIMTSMVKGAQDHTDLPLTVRLVE